MTYQEYKPSSDLQSLVKCYWTLEVPASTNSDRQLILPDGCVDLCFILGDDIKRYTSEKDFIIQPRQMLLGQITEQFYIQPMGAVNTFSIRFYPHGFANFIDTPLIDLSNKETPISQLFGQSIAARLNDEMSQASDTKDRIDIIESFLQARLQDKKVINNIVQSTIEAMLSSKGSISINNLIKDDLDKRRQLERNFKKQIGLSPKQLCKVIRLQATLQMMLDQKIGKLTDIAYESEYYDQAHFIKDFKEFTGITPKEFLTDEKMTLSALLYKKK